MIYLLDALYSEKKRVGNHNVSLNMLNMAYKQTQLDFLELCMLGDDFSVRKALLSGRVDPEFANKMNGWTALHWAATRGHEIVCILLLEAGFSREARDLKGRTPFEVYKGDNETLREILKPETGGEEDGEEEMSDASVWRRASCGENNTFVPNYKKNPPFPFTSKNSFDSVTSQIPGSPTTPTNNNSVYSYGRRDSLQKTRFLLLRTSIGKGKETFKRITLPGGSTVDRLKVTIEKACKGRPVDAIFTLPDRILVEEDDQIHMFADCQKIDVIFGDEREDVTPPPKGDAVMSSSKENTPVKEHTYPEAHAEVEIPSSVPEEERTTPQIEVQQQPEEQHTESRTKEASPPVSITATDVDSNTDSAPEILTLNDNGSSNEEPKLIPLASRNSLDSDPGDFVKVEKEHGEDPSPAVAGLAANIPIINAEVQEKLSNPEHLSRAPSPAPLNLYSPSSKATIVEESKERPDGSQDSDIATWIHNNPNTVRNVAAAAAVAGVVGLGCYVYIKKVK